MFSILTDGCLPLGGDDPLMGIGERGPFVNRNCAQAPKVQCKARAGLKQMVAKQKARLGGAPSSVVRLDLDQNFRTIGAGAKTGSGGGEPQQLPFSAQRMPRRKSWLSMSRSLIGA